MIEDDLKIKDEKVTTSAALMAAQQVAERQRELAFQLSQKAAVVHLDEVATDRDGENADDGRIDKGEEDKLAASKGVKVAVDKDGDVPGSQTTSETTKEEAPVPTRGTTIVDLNA